MALKTSFSHLVMCCVDRFVDRHIPPALTLAELDLRPGQPHQLVNFMGRERTDGEELQALLLSQVTIKSAIRLCHQQRAEATIFHRDFGLRIGHGHAERITLTLPRQARIDRFPVQPFGRQGIRLALMHDHVPELGGSLCHQITRQEAHQWQVWTDVYDAADHHRRLAGWEEYQRTNGVVG